MIPFEADIAALIAYRDELPDFFDLDDVRAAAPSHTIVDTAFRAMVRAYVSRPAPRYDAQVDAALQVAAMVLGAAGGHGPRVFREVALRVSHPAAHKELAPLLRTILHDELVPPLLEAIDSDDPQVAGLAISLAGWAFFGRWAAPLTAGQAQMINVAVELRSARGADAADLRAALARWTPVVSNC